MVCGFIFVWHNKYTFKNITYNAQCMIYKYIYILYNKIFPYKILLYNSVFAWELVYFNFINEMSLNYYVIKNPFNLRLPYDNNIITLNKKPLVPQPRADTYIMLWIANYLSVLETVASGKRQPKISAQFVCVCVQLVIAF